MKKTHNINLSGYGFVIDEDAYEMLDTYLTTLEEICARAGVKETAADIEQRIAEIFLEDFSSDGRHIFTLADVECVIGRMGSPEEIMEGEVFMTVEADGATNAINEDPQPVQASRFNVIRRKRLYRDTDDRVLGGVCSGIGWYFGIDPVWVRVIAVAGAFLSLSTLAVIYLVLWIVVPAAKTPFERMQMMGIDPSMENVGKVVTGDYNKKRDVASGIGRILLMILVGFGLLVVGCVLLAMVAAFAGCLVALCVVPVKYGDYTMVNARLVFGLVMGGSVIVGIPVFLLFRSLLGVLLGRHLPSFSTGQNFMMLFLWLLGVAAVITCGCLL